MADDQPLVTLAEHERSQGIWLCLAKKGTTEPTTLTYDEALDEALCHGWIDGQVRRLDERTYRQRFTPRRPRSAWSKRNVSIAERLTAEGRMTPAGAAAIERARADGRWEAAYCGPAEIEVPADLTAALTTSPKALAMFEILTSQNRYSVLLRISNAKRTDTRTRRIQQFVAMLARGDTPYPQKRTLPPSPPPAPTSAKRFALRAGRNSNRVGAPRRWEQRPDDPEDGNEDADDEHHPVALADRKDA